MPEYRIDVPPHPYVPAGPVEGEPGGGYQPPEVRREAFAAVLKGVPLGAYEQQHIEWLVGLDDSTCRTLASLMWRLRELPEGAVTEWGVRFTPGGYPAETPCADEDNARSAVAAMREGHPEWDAILIWRTPEHPAGPWTEADNPSAEPGQTREDADNG
jgi:hypothetical protein